METIFAFLQSDWATIVTGLMALVAFGETLVRWGRTIIVRPRVWFSPIWFCEVGYGQFGPTIALIGTLHCEMKSLFIDNVIIDVRLRDSDLKMSFSWLLSRDIAITIKENEARFTNVYPFLLAVNAAKPMNVIFRDSSRHDIMMSYLIPFRENFTGFCTGLSRIVQLPHSREAAVTVCWEHFQKSSAYKAVNSFLAENFPWREGEYTLDIAVTSKGRLVKIEKSKFKFSLTRKQISDLEANFPAIQQEIYSVAHFVEQQKAYPNLEQAC